MDEKGPGHSPQGRVVCVEKGSGVPLLKGDGRGGGEAEAFLDAFDGGHEALQDGRYGEAA